jgi:hypothetical protein
LERFLTVVSTFIWIGMPMLLARGLLALLVYWFD